MDFAEADSRYVLLKQRYDARELGAAAFDNALRDLMVLDEQGRWWAKSRETGDWNYKDPATGAWIKATPPGFPPKQRPRPPAAESDSSRSPGRPEGQIRRGATVLLQAADDAPVAKPLSFWAAGLLYLISLFVPLVGFVVFALLRNRPAPSDRTAARVALVLAIIAIIFWAYMRSY